MEDTVNFYIEKLFEYFDVHTISELALKINVQQPVISGWKARNSINPIKKKCRELGIYNEIFGDSSVSIIQGSGGRAAGRDYQEGEKATEQPQLDELTMSLVKKLIDKIGEDELQFKLMELIKNG